MKCSGSQVVVVLLKLIPCQRMKFVTQPSDTDDSFSPSATMSMKILLAILFSWDWVTRSFFLSCKRKNETNFFSSSGHLRFLQPPLLRADFLFNTFSSASCCLHVITLFSATPYLRAAAATELVLAKDTTYSFTLTEIRFRNSPIFNQLGNIMFLKHTTLVTILGLSS